MKKLYIFLIFTIILCSFASADIANPEMYLTLDTLVGGGNGTYDDASWNDNDFLTDDINHMSSANCILDECAQGTGLTSSRLYQEDGLALWEDNEGTFSFWINTTSGTSYTSIFANRVFDGPSGKYCSAIIGVELGRLFIDVSNQHTNCEATNTRIGRDFWRSSITINDGLYHHVSFASDNTTYWVYVDGVRDTALTSVPVGTLSQGRWFDETSGGSASTMLGWKFGDLDVYLLAANLDEVGYYDYNLTGPSTNCTADNSSEVCQLYNGGIGFMPVNFSINLNATATIMPAAPNNGTQLTGYCNSSTIFTGSNISFSTVWKRNSVVLESTRIENVSLAPNVNHNLTTFPSGNLTAGDIIELLCEAVHEDSSATSGWVTSEAKTILSTTKTVFNVRVLHAISGGYISGVTINVTNATYSNQTTSSGTWERIVVPTGGTYNLSATHLSYGTVNKTETIVVGTEEYITFSMGGVITANIFNEALSGVNGSNVPFNMSKPSDVEFGVYCVDDTQTIKSKINTNSYEFVLNCEYRRFELFVSYTGGATYFRRFIENTTSLNASGAFNVYLANAFNDTIVEITFSLVDFGNRYKNPRLIVSKVINSEKVVITADYVENNIVTGYLLQNEEYILELESDNLPTLSFGYYTPTSDETKYLSLDDLTLAPSPIGVSAVSHSAWSSNSTGVLTAHMLYEDTDQDTTFATWMLYENSTDNSAFSNRAMSVTNGTGWYDSVDISAYENKTVVAKLVIVRDSDVREIPDYVVTILVGADQKITLPITEWFGQKWIDWVITIVLMMILLYGVSTNIPITLMVVGVLGAAFRIFGWYSLPVVYTALIILLGLLGLIKPGGNK